MADILFKIVGDDTDVRKKLKELSKLQGESGQAFQKAFKGGGEGVRSVQEALTGAIKKTNQLDGSFAGLTGSVSDAHLGIAKVRAETQSLSQTEKDLRKALKDNIITEDEYIEKLALISQKRTELSDKLKEYRAELKKTQVEQSKTKPYTAADTAYEVANQHGAGKEFNYLPPVSKIEELRNAIKELEAQEESLSNKFLEGKMSSDEFSSAIDGVKKSQSQLNEQMKLAKEGEFFDWDKVGTGTDGLQGLQKVLASVSEDYRKLLEAGLESYAGLDEGTSQLAKTLVDLEGESKQNIKIQDELKASYSRGKLTFDEYRNATEAMRQKQIETRVAIAEVKKEIQDQASAQIGANGSLIEAAKKLKELEIAWKGLSEAQRNNPAIVGKMKQEAAEMKAVLSQYQLLAQEAPKLTTQLRLLKNEMATMVISGKQNTDEYEALRKKAVELESALFAVGQEMKAQSSYTTGIDTAIRATSALVSGFTIAQGASALLGDKNEDLQKSILKVTAAMSILNGLQQIQAELKRADSIATIGQTAAQRAYAMAVGTSTGILKAFRLALVGTGIGALVVALGLAVQYFMKLRDQSKAATAAQKEFNDAMKEAPKTASSARVELTRMSEQIKLVKEGKIDATKALKKYNEGLGKTFGAAKDLNSAEQMIVKNGDAYIKMMLAKAKATGVAELAAKQYSKVIETGMKSDEDVLGITLTDGLRDNDVYMASVKRRAEKKRKIEVDEEEKKYSAFEKLMIKHENEVANISKKSGLNQFDDTDTSDKVNKAFQKELDKRQTLLNKLIDLNAGYLRKSLTQDEEEIQAVTDKYATIRREIEAFNKSAKKPISLVEFDIMADAAKEDITYRQETKELGKELEIRKKLYDDFEAYKTATSLERANKRFAEQLPLIMSHESDLAKSIAELQDKADKTGGESERLKALLEAQKKLSEEKQKIIDTETISAIKAAETHAQKLEKINDDYYKSVLRLSEGASIEELNMLDDKRDAAVQAANDEAFLKTKIYKKAAEEAMVITRAQLKEEIKAVEQLLADGSITGALKERLENELSSLKINLNLGVKSFNLDSLKAERDNIQKAINKNLELNNLESFDSLTQSAIDANPELKKLIQRLKEVSQEINRVKKSSDDGATGIKGFIAKLEGNDTLAKFNEWATMASGAFSDMSNALGGVDTQAGYALNTLGELVGTAADIGGAIASGNPVQIVGAIAKGVSTVFSIGKRVKEMNAAARKSVADFYAQAISGEKEYQNLINEQEISSIRDNKTRLLGIRDEITLRKKQADADAKEFKETMVKVRGQKYIQDQTYKHGSWFKKAKVTNVMGSLEGKSFEQLKELLLAGKLEGETKALVERLVELEQKGYDAAQALADLAKETAEIFTGTTADSLTESLASMFSEGKTGAQDLADFFESTMQDAAMSIFKNKVLAGLMEDFYKDFAAAAESDDELTAAEIETLRTKWMEDTEKANKRWEQMQEVTGMPKKTESNTQTLRGSIMGSCTEESMNKMESRTIKINITCQH